MQSVLAAESDSASEALEICDVVVCDRCHNFMCGHCANRNILEANALCPHCRAPEDTLKPFFSSQEYAVYTSNSSGLRALGENFKSLSGVDRDVLEFQCPICMELCYVPKLGHALERVLQNSSFWSSDDIEALMACPVDFTEWLSERANAYEEVSEITSPIYFKTDGFNLLTDLEAMDAGDAIEMCDFIFSDGNLRSFQNFVFRGCHFGDVNFSLADLRDVSFVDCTFFSVNFYGCQFRGCSFEKCDIESSNFSDAIWDGDLFDNNCRLSSVTFNHRDARNAGWEVDEDESESEEPLETDEDESDSESDWDNDSSN